MIAALPKMRRQAVRLCGSVGPFPGRLKGVKHVPRAIHTWNPRKLIEHLLVVVILLGLVYLVYWVITEEPRPRYPGIEKLRGQSGPDRDLLLASVIPDAATFLTQQLANKG